MVRDNLVGTAELLERRRPQLLGVRCTFHVPKALHDELQVGGFDGRRPAVSSDLYEAATLLDAFCPDAVEHRLDQSRLDRYARPLELVPPLDRSDDRGSAS